MQPGLIQVLCAYVVGRRKSSESVQLTMMMSNNNDTNISICCVSISGNEKRSNNRIYLLHTCQRHIDLNYTHTHLTFLIEDRYRALGHTLHATFAEWLFAAECLSRQPPSSSTRVPARASGSGLGAGWDGGQAELERQWTVRQQPWYLRNSRENSWPLTKSRAASVLSAAWTHTHAVSRTHTTLQTCTNEGG